MIHATMTSARKKMKILITRYQIPRARPLHQHFSGRLCDASALCRPLLHFESRSVERWFDHGCAFAESAGESDRLSARRRHGCLSTRRNYFGLPCSR
jgi:hypothetical protein